MKKKRGKPRSFKILEQPSETISSPGLKDWKGRHSDSHLHIYGRNPWTFTASPSTRNEMASVADRTILSFTNKRPRYWE